MPEETITLKCTSNSLVKGELIKVGETKDFPKEQAKHLLSTNRFVVDEVQDDAGEQDAAELSVAELKAALDELGVEYAKKATKAELTAALAEAESNE